MWKCGNSKPTNETGGGGGGGRGQLYCENGHAMHAEWCRIYYQFSPFSHSPSREACQYAGGWGCFTVNMYIYYIHCI